MAVPNSEKFAETNQLACDNVRLVLARRKGYTCAVSPARRWGTDRWNCGVAQLDTRLPQFSSGQIILRGSRVRQWRTATDELDSAE